MKKVVLKSLELSNFKGVRHYKLETGCGDVSIYGTNEAGKTTLVDAFSWVLYGKNSENKKDFDIKTFDENGVTIPKLEHYVEAVLLIDETELLLKRLYKEKWTKKRGNDFEEMTGHETEYFINNVPVQQGEYNRKISDILDENVAKVLTDVWYFNQQMKWNERREVLTQIVGDVSDIEIAERLENSSELIQLITSGANLVEKKKELTAKRKLLENEVKEIDPRIAEAKTSVVNDLDFEQLQAELDVKEKEYYSIDEQLLDSSKRHSEQLDKIAKQREEKAELENQLRVERNKAHELVKDKELELTTELNNLKREILTKQNKIQENNDYVKSIKSRIETLEKENDILRSEKKGWQESEFVLSERETNCPTCKRELENLEEIKESLKANFNKNKTERIAGINKKGIENKETIERYQKDLNTFREAIKDIELQIEATQKKVAEIEENKPKFTFEPTQKELELRKQIETFVIDEVVKDEEQQNLIEKKQNIRVEIDQLKQKLSQKFVNEKQQARIEQLQEQKRAISNEIAQLERVEMQIENHNLHKMTEIEQRVNSKFKLVKFKMFEQQINGGYANTCYCTFKGVPFDSLNNASKINVGLDIIETLQLHYGIMAPVFIDNRESVVNLHETMFQVISLVVDGKEKELKIK